MDKKYLLKSAIKMARITRILAKIIDIFIVLILSFLLYPVGILFGAIYMGGCDALQRGQSVGKRFMGFSVISLEDGKPCSLKQSIIRNLPFLIPLLFCIFPIWGWLLAFLIGFPLIILEVYLMFNLDSGHRLGDVMADTTVMANDDSKVVTKRNSSWYEPKNSAKVYKK